MTARAWGLGCCVALSAVLVGCASGGEPEPTVTVTETVAITPSPGPSVSPTDGSAPAPEEAPVDDVEAHGTFLSEDGTIAFSHPGSWSVRELSVPGLGTRVTVERSGGVVLLDIWVAPLQDATTSLCDASTEGWYPMIVVDSEPVDPISAPSDAAAPPLVLATMELGDDFGGVAILQASHASIDCLDLGIPVGGATLVASTPWRDGADPLVYDAYPGGAVDFVGSFEHGRILELLRSLVVTV